MFRKARVVLAGARPTTSIRTPNRTRAKPIVPPMTRVHVPVSMPLILAGRRPGSAVVRELQGDAEVLLLEQRLDGLQIVPLLAGDPQLVALDLRLHALGAVLADLLADQL